LENNQFIRLYVKYSVGDTKLITLPDGCTIIYDPNDVGYKFKLTNGIVFEYSTMITSDVKGVMFDASFFTQYGITPNLMKNYLYREDTSIKIEEPELTKSQQDKLDSLQLDLQGIFESTRILDKDDLLRYLGSMGKTFDYFQKDKVTLFYERILSSQMADDKFKDAWKNWWDRYIDND